MEIDDVSSAWLAEQVPERSARAIAAHVGALIRSGELPAGARLPTVRAFAAAMQVSPGTIAEAWAALRRSRAIASHGRRGTVVAGPPAPPRPSRFERVGLFGSRLSVDLSLMAPDHDLLPGMAGALTAALGGEALNEYARVAITPELAEAVRPGWPFPPARMVAVSGGFDGLQLLSTAAVRPGDRVAVEDPTTPRLFDILSLVGAEAIPVACDEAGPVPEALHEALRRTCAAFVYQPRAQSPCGHALRPGRAERLARLLAPTSTLVIENDSMAELSTEPPVSIGAWLPEQTALVRSFSKSHGPDLRIAVVGGPAEIIDQTHRLQMFGAGWVSRVLQNALGHLLRHPAAVETVSRARREYAARRDTLIRELGERDVRVHNRDGLSLWIPVADEQEALVTLAAHGIAAGPGSRFWLRSDRRDHIRVSISRVRGDFAPLAESLAVAASAGNQRP
ncbi:aminotransferase-like domain-containing protein [Qaidamihabitans albus]|uniref:aminotransferase-like domain-containing protein n=1 Tax=Qaidamihabitans albus TaxID=2795733 RepID=UPI0018F19A5E|nr:PLP-dependent aminotransferase family protein [Qaidamihabitans albus]